MSLFPFFFAIFFLSLGQAQAPKKKAFFVPQISIKMTLSGDMSNTYQFNGALGDFIIGEPENAEGSCENTSSFQKVLYRQKKSIQVWMRLKCTISEQSFSFKPQRFFVELDKPTSTFSLPAQSEKFQKISIQLSEIQLKDSPQKK